MESSPSLHSPTAAQGEGAKRQRRDVERSKVTRACDRCKSYARGRLPHIQAAAEVEAAGTPQYRMPSRDSSLPTTSTTTTTAGSLARHTPEPSSSMTDLQGHYIGATSGVSFLLRIQRRLLAAASFSFSLPNSTIFTFGDAPLKEPEVDTSFCMMLGRDDALRLVDRYFDFAMPTYRFLHRPTIRAWFDEFYDTLGLMSDAQRQSAPGKIALLFMVFAQGRVYMPDHDRPGPADLSTRYFLAAEHHLAKERGSVRLTSVQSRLVQCYYLLTQSRINHCWSLFGTVSHLALAIGLNRNPGSGMSQLEAENRRRTFWCLYTLDVYLSVALGRPRTFHDEDIDTELPECIDDHELSDSLSMGALRNVPNLQPSPLIIAGSISHFKLAQIIGQIIRKLYPIRPIPLAQRATWTKKISNELRAWRATMARFLDADTFSTLLLLPIYQRQRNMLNLTYWHAVILTHRPYLLSHFTRQFSRRTATAEDDDNDRDGGTTDAQTAESMQQCLTAAVKTVTSMEEIAQTHQMFRSFWTTAYFAFTATIVLYIYIIHKRASPPEQYQEYFIAAAKCQKYLSCIAEPGSLSERYCLVLEELRLEAKQQTGHFCAAVAPGGGHGNTAAGSIPGTNTTISSVGDNADPALSARSHNGTSSGISAEFPAMNSSPSDGTADTVGTLYTDCINDESLYSQNYMGQETAAVEMSDHESWEQFASMISSGMGNLDILLQDSSFSL